MIDALSQAPATPATTPTSAASGNVKGTKDEFLKLFMAQLQHQDPFAPTSGADMVAQLAQLSSVEQAKQTNEQLAELAAQQASAASAGLATLVGRDCSAAASTFQIDRAGGQTVPPIDVTAASPMKGASLVIENAEGKEVRRLPIPDGATSSTVAWDGKDASGNLLASGAYKIKVDAGKTTSDITSQWRGRVDAVELTPDGARLRMGGLLLAPSEIRTIGASGATTTSTTTAGVSK